MTGTITLIDNHQVYLRILNMDPDFKENARYMINTAGIHEDMASSYRDLELYEKSFYHIQISVEILEKLVRNDPDNISYLTSLGSMFNNIARLFMITSDFKEAQDYYLKAMDIQNKLMELSVVSLRKVA